MARHKSLARTRRYLDAGVDIERGRSFVEAIKPLAARTERPGCLPGSLEGFAALFDLRAAGFRDPLLVAAADGVGTKLKLASELRRHEGIGVDLVAMCVNDLVVTGAEPLFFLDYLALGHLDRVLARSIMAGIVQACQQVGCALLGGETAEMPGLYRSGEYDVAGFALGALERGEQLGWHKVSPDDIILGLGASGLHANGFALVRKIVAELGLSYQLPAPFDSAGSLGGVLLTPTRLYVRSVLAAARAGYLKAAAHITGGGLIGNIPRIIPQGLTAVVSSSSWEWPEVFAWLAQDGTIGKQEMLQVFNCGIGMALIVAPDQAANVQQIVERHGERVSRIGVVLASSPDAPAIQID